MGDMDIAYEAGLEDGRTESRARIASLEAALRGLMESPHTDELRDGHVAGFCRRCADLYEAGSRAIAARSALEASAVPTHNHDIVDGSTFDFCGACGTLPASAVPEPTDRLRRAAMAVVLAAKKMTPEMAELNGALAATPPGPHTSREEQIERIENALVNYGAFTERGEIHLTYDRAPTVLYDAGLRAEPTREAEGREDDGE